MRLLLFILAIIVLGFTDPKAQQPGETTSLFVKKCNDFDLTGKGDNYEWTKTEWINLIKLDSGGKIYTTKFKVLYSAKGIYVLFNCDDEKITTQYDKDFGYLYNGDVVEVFFHPDPKMPLYFEYEVNQLNKELVLLVPNIYRKAYGWIPWRYEKNRMIKKMVNIVTEKNNSNKAISSWSAEIFFPYDLLSPLANVPPTSGAVWNANFYRLDYDNGKQQKWAWSPVNKSFHEYEKFGRIRFE